MDAARVVLVTNVSQGFGRAAALALGAAGHDVVCADRDVDQASRTAAEIEELGGQAIPVQADMSAQIDVQSTFHKVLEIFGELDGVVHVVSEASNAPFRSLAENEFSELFADSLRSSYLTMKTALRLQTGHMWLVLIGPPRNAVEPHMAALHGALKALSESYDRRNSPRFRSNIIIPSRAASDPKHDAALADTVRFLSSQGDHGMFGQTIEVELPPPPRITESLLPEVRAALDASVRQDDLEASHFDDDSAEDTGSEAGQTAAEDELDDEFEYSDEFEDLGAEQFEEFMDDWERGFFSGIRRERFG